MPGFLSAAAKKQTDVRSFLRDAAGSNSIKYTPEKGAKHLLYIPYRVEDVVDENGNHSPMNRIIAISGAVHEWNGIDGKYRATVCMKGVVRHAENGTVLNDGSCPFCERVSDAWDIFRYRKELEERRCTLTGDDRKKHFEHINSTLADERKAKETREYIYILVVKFRLNKDDEPVIGDDKLPEFDLKVMKLSASRVEKIEQQISNAGSEFAGSEIIMQYPESDDRRLVVSQSTTAPVFPQSMMIAKFPALKSKIDSEVSKFEWEGIEKSFPEWAGMTQMEAEKITSDLFEAWDRYKKEKEVSPNAQYLEYVGGSSTPSTPAMDAGSVPAIPGMGGVSLPPLPDIGALTGAPGMGVHGAAGNAGIGVPGAAPQPPQPPIMGQADPNSAFGGAPSSITI